MENKIQQCLKILGSILAGGTDLKQAVRSLISHLTSILSPEDPDVGTLIFIDSEMDDFPSGEKNQDWAHDVFVKKKAEREQFERDHRDALVAACRNLIAKLETKANDR